MVCLSDDHDDHDDDDNVDAADYTTDVRSKELGCNVSIELDKKYNSSK